MALVSDVSATLLEELRRAVAERGIERMTTDGEPDLFVPPAKVPAELAQLAGRALSAPPLAVAVDVYGTLLASAAGEIGPGAAADDYRAVFPHDMAEHLHSLVVDEHAVKRAEGIPWPEIDAAALFAKALGLDYEDGARAAVAWECTTNRCSAMPGAAAFLAGCANRGISLGIVSNAQFYTPLFVEEAFDAYLFGERRFSDRELFDTAPVRPCLGFDPGLTLWSYRTGRAKPDRWMFDELVRRLAARGVPPDRILYVGNDALNDCAAAGEAGLMTALFCGDERSCRPRTGEPRVLAYPPSTLVSSWDDLWRLVCI
jgi:putative hydrolase of the HAD superfamily